MSLLLLDDLDLDLLISNKNPLHENGVEFSRVRGKENRGGAYFSLV